MTGLNINASSSVNPPLLSGSSFNGYSAFFTNINGTTISASSLTGYSGLVLNWRFV